MTDYSTQGFTVPVEMDDARGYASIHAELYREEDGLENTGNYFVYLLHPVFGSTHFTLESLGGSVRPFKKEGGAYWVSAEMVQQVIDAIIERK
jgi:hypothetical protein